MSDLADDLLTIAALRHLAEELRHLRVRCTRQAELARPDWEGSTRRWFEDRLAEVTAGLARAASAAEDGAAAIGAPR